MDKWMIRWYWRTKRSGFMLGFKLTDGRMIWGNRILTYNALHAYLVLGTLVASSPRRYEDTGERFSWDDDK